MTESIKNYNSKGEFHGYQEWYIFVELYLRGYYKNGMETGYEEFHNEKETSYYIR